jgi:hypothetical protein
MEDLRLTRTVESLDKKVKSLETSMTTMAGISEHLIELVKACRIRISDLEKRLAEDDHK